jgi:uncharacterized protein (DUF362 family)
MDKNIGKYTPKVAIVSDEKVKYSKVEPFNPNKNFPELRGLFNETDESNNVYEMVRESLYLLGFDKKNYGKASWNPLGEIVSPGEKVVIKPNAVADINRKKGEDVYAVISHGSVMRAIIDYTYIALKGKGKIIIADSPIVHTDFDNWKKVVGIKKIQDLYSKKFNFKIETYDLRELYAPYSKMGFVPTKEREIKKRDPLGYSIIDLKDKSLFSEFSQEDIKRICGSDYDRSVTVRNHLGGHHRYRVSNSVLSADTIISIPKLKTHKEAGTTLNIKNFVGSQGDKNYIPHYRVGLPKNGGDEYPDQGFIQNLINGTKGLMEDRLLSKNKPSLEKIYFFLNLFRFSSQKLLRLLMKIIHGKRYRGNIIGGGWYGNDTVWRTAIDVARIVLYSDKKGKMQNTIQRKFLFMIDGIIAGEKNGPLAPDKKNCGVIISGNNFLWTDFMATRLMGLNPRKIPLYFRGEKLRWLTQDTKLAGVKIYSNKERFKKPFETKDSFFDLKPAWGWRDYIEINRGDTYLPIKAPKK